MDDILQLLARWLLSRLLPTLRASWKLSPKFSIRFSSDGRPPHIPSLIRTAAWDERCSGVEESCALSLPGPRKKNRPLRRWGFRLLRESHAAHATRGPQSAWSQRRHQSQPSSSQANSCGHTKERCASPANLLTSPRYLQSWPQFWTSPEAHTRWRKSSW